MVEFSQRLRFTGEPLGKSRILADSWRQDFEGDHSVEFLLPGSIDRAHAALANEIQDFQLRKEATNLCRGGGDERRSPAFRLAVWPDIHAGAQSSLDQTLRAQTVWSIGGQRLPATAASFRRIHFHRIHNDTLQPVHYGLP